MFSASSGAVVLITALPRWRILLVNDCKKQTMLVSTTLAPPANEIGALLAQDLSVNHVRVVEQICVPGSTRLEEIQHVLSPTSTGK